MGKTNGRRQALLSHTLISWTDKVQTYSGEAGREGGNMYFSRQRQGSRAWTWETRKGKTVIGTRTVLEKRRGVGQSGKLVSLNNSALN